MKIRHHGYKREGGAEVPATEEQNPAGRVSVREVICASLSFISEPTTCVFAICVERGPARMRRMEGKVR